MTRILVAILILFATTTLVRAEAMSVPLLEFGFSERDIIPATPLNETSPRTVELLSAAFAASVVPQRRVELVADLGRTGLPQATPTVILAMRDADASVRAEAARAAGRLNDLAAAEHLAKLLSDAAPTVRIEAIRAGAALGKHEFVEAGLSDVDTSVFAAAAALAVTAEDCAKIATRLPALPPRQRCEAITALSKRNVSAHIAVIVDQIESDDLAVRIAAIQALGLMNAVEASPELKGLLTDIHPAVRRSAIRALRVLSAADHVTIARAMLQDRDLAVRAASIGLLIDHPSQEDLPAVAEQLGQPDSSLNQAARDALIAAGRAGIPAADAVAVELLNHADAARREDGSFILGRIGSRAALERHIALLQDQSPRVAAQAADSLGRIGANEAVAPLRVIATRAESTKDFSQLREGEAEIITNSILSAGRLRDREVIELARKLIPRKTDCPHVIRAAAIWAAGACALSEDRELASQFISVFRDTSLFETDDVRFEAMKALGNMNCSAVLSEVRIEASRHPRPALRWIAHTVGDRLAGATTAYVPPSAPFVAETSIRDLPAQ